MLHSQAISKKFILSFLFVFSSLISSADWKGYFDHSEVIALVKCTKTSENSEKITVLKCYKGNLKEGDELKLTTHFREIVGIFGRTNLVIFADIKTNNSIEKSYKINRWLQLQGKSIECNLYDSEPTEYTAITQFKNFDRFLEAYSDTSLRPKVYKEILKKLKRAKHVGQVTLYLMELYILGFSQYHPIFRDFVNVNSSSLQYALLHLMGNIRTDESRALLNLSLSSQRMWLVGMTIQMLANDTPEKAGPILLERFKMWSKEKLERKWWSNHVSAEGSSPDWGGYQPFISMFQNEPTIVQERYVSSLGRWEVIEAFGKLRYEPAGPYLVSFLDKCDDYEYEAVMEVLNIIGYQDFSNHIKNQLDANNHEKINWLVEKIINDSLIECLPNLINYTSRVDRSTYCNSHFLVSPDRGLGVFSDTIATNFLFHDFEKFLKTSARLRCDKIETWNSQYIKSLSKNRDERARPLINQLLLEN